MVSASVVAKVKKVTGVGVLTWLTVEYGFSFWAYRCHLVLGPCWISVGVFRSSCSIASPFFGQWRGRSTNKVWRVHIGSPGPSISEDLPFTVHPVFLPTHQKSRKIITKHQIKAHIICRKAETGLQIDDLRMPYTPVLRVPGDLGTLFFRREGTCPADRERLFWRGAVTVWPSWTKWQQLSAGDTKSWAVAMLFIGPVVTISKECIYHMESYSFGSTWMFIFSADRFTINVVDGWCLPLTGQPSPGVQQYLSPTLHELAPACPCGC